MKKQISMISDGVNSQVADFLVNRLLPSRYVDAVGPIVFLDHIYPTQLKTAPDAVPNGDFAHPHRGIATFSYVLDGRLTHYDSRGNHSTINAGGVQWMKSGNGIIHDEMPLPADSRNRSFHSLQFWINLPAAVKVEEPEYQALEAEEVPELQLPDNGGKLRVLLGAFGTAVSPIKTFNGEFIFHLRLNPKSELTITANKGIEYAAFVPATELTINDARIENSKIVIFENKGEDMNFRNQNIAPADVLIFGGLRYMQGIAAEGPFVMNNRAEIAMAYRDFFDGKYGSIDYNRL